MIEYRPFRNTDAPLLAEIWRSQGSHRGLMQPMSAALFEAQVLSKSIFDRFGLILAVEDGKPLGFVHAGFGATGDERALEPKLGVISILMLRLPDTLPGVAAELLRQAETYLHSRGATSIVAGGAAGLNPFYLGLSGGSEKAGLLTSDAAAQVFFGEHGYRPEGRAEVLHRELARFRPIVDRLQMQIRRRTSLQVVPDPPARSWWDAATFGGFDRTLLTLHPREAGPPVARAMFWKMEPLDTSWGIHAAGLVELEVDPNQRRQGLATYLLGEAFRHLHGEGIAVVEGQVRDTNLAARGLLAKLGFEPVDECVVFRKELGTAGETEDAGDIRSSRASGY